MRYQLAPSILSANFAQLGDDIRTVAQAGAHYIHFDVMDGHFVPNLSFGLPVLHSIRSVTSLPFDVHLMVNHPENFVEAFARAGADIINIHYEATEDLTTCLRRIRALGKKAAFTLKPGTAIAAVLPFVEWADMILIMSVEPGFGGQAFMPEALHKAELLAEYIQRNGLRVDIEMDGGIDLTNARSVLAAGVNILVAGSAVFARTQEETVERVRAFLSL